MFLGDVWGFGWGVGFSVTFIGTGKLKADIDFWDLSNIKVDFILGFTSSSFYFFFYITS